MGNESIKLDIFQPNLRIQLICPYAKNTRSLIVGSGWDRGWVCRGSVSAVSIDLQCVANSSNDMQLAFVSHLKKLSICCPFYNDRCSHRIKHQDTWSTAVTVDINSTIDFRSVGCNLKRTVVFPIPFSKIVHIGRVRVLDRILCPQGWCQCHHRQQCEEAEGAFFVRFGAVCH